MKSLLAASPLNKVPWDGERSSPPGYKQVRGEPNSASGCGSCFKCHFNPSFHLPYSLFNRGMCLIGRGGAATSASFPLQLLPHPQKEPLQLNLLPAGRMLLPENSFTDLALPCRLWRRCPPCARCCVGAKLKAEMPEEAGRKK